MLSAKFELTDVVKFIGDIEELTPRGRSAALAQFATVEIAKADVQNEAATGVKLAKRTFVDGRESNNFSAVRPDGSIVAVWEFGEEIVRWIYKALRDLAPVLTGEYRDSITIFADETAVPGPEHVREAEQVLIMATVPYARKLEGENTQAKLFKADKRNKGKAAKYMSSQAPEGVFQVIAERAKRRFGNQAKILYTFRGLSGMTSTLEGWAIGRRAKNARKVGAAKARRQYDKDVRNPAILIMFK